MNQYFKVQETEASPGVLLFYIAVSYLFAIVWRLAWTWHYSDQSEYFWNGELILSTHDGYYWLEIVRGILNGESRSIAPSLLPHLAATIARTLPIQIETLAVYLPMILGSLIVVPMILVSQSLKIPTVGLLAALFACIAHSYLNRTIPGYFDTDMLNVVLPMLMVWGGIEAINRRSLVYVLLTVAMAMLYYYWHPSSVLLSSSILLIVLAYLTILNHRFAYVFMAVLAGLVFWLTQSGFDSIEQIVSRYILRGDLIEHQSSPPNASGVFEVTNQFDFTSEATPVDAFTLAQRISGHPLAFLVGLTGFALLLARHRVLVLALPSLVLGLSAVFIGLRFTIYAVPVASLGTAYITIIAAEIVGQWSIHWEKVLRPFAIIVIASLLLYPNIGHVIDYKIPLALTRNEIVTLEGLKEVANRNDKVVSWWDYGYAIRYFTNLEPVVDGSTNRLDQLFPVAYLLTVPDQKSSAKLTGLLTVNSDRPIRHGIYDLLNEEGFQTITEFLFALLSDSIKCRKPKYDTYLYLPDLLSIYSVILGIGNVQSYADNQLKAPFFRFHSAVSRTPDGKFVGANGELLADGVTGRFLDEGDIEQVKQLIEVKYDQNKRSFLVRFF